MKRIMNRVNRLQDEIDENYINESQKQNMQPPPSRTYHQDREYEPSHGFGDTKDPVRIATSIEDNPMPPGICEILIGGRPIDLHMFENYMVWRVSPYQMRTVLRYRTARIMEEIKNYSSSPKAKMGGNFFIMLIIIIIMLVVGIGIFTYMPQITAFFKGFAWVYQIN